MPELCILTNISIREELTVDVRRGERLVTPSATFVRHIGEKWRMPHPGEGVHPTTDEAWEYALQRLERIGDHAYLHADAMHRRLGLA